LLHFGVRLPPAPPLDVVVPPEVVPPDAAPPLVVVVVPPEVEPPLVVEVVPPEVVPPLAVVPPVVAPPDVEVVALVSSPDVLVEEPPLVPPDDESPPEVELPAELASLPSPEPAELAAISLEALPTASEILSPSASAAPPRPTPTIARISAYSAAEAPV